MEFMLDTANLDNIKAGLDIYPIIGVTTNPSILKKEGNVDFFGHLSQIRALIGPERSLHVQVVSQDTKHIIEEAEKIRYRLGENTFVKVPVTEDGLRAIKYLSAEKFHITATVVYTTIQGMMAMLAGARYIACYYNRMLNCDIDASRVIHELSNLLWASHGDCQIMAASFKNINEITTAFSNGASCCTVPFDLLKTGLSNPSISNAVQDFDADWTAIHGPKKIFEL
jgi:transaldolase